MSENKANNRANARDGTTPSAAGAAHHWIEILEPKTKVQMFANLMTGECRWDEPRGSGVVISRATNPSLTQWWELFDSNSQRFYYYCAKDSKTVWKRPQTDDAIVVPLAKLQILKQNTCSSTANATPDDRTTRTSAEVSTQTEPQLCSRATQTTTSSTNESPFGISFRNPSLKHYLISEARLTHAMRVRDTDVTQELDFDSNDDDFDDVLDDSDVSCDADDEYDCDYSDDNMTDDDSGEDRPDGRYERHNRYDDTTEDDIRRRYDNCQTVDKQRDRQQINSLFATTTATPPKTPTSDGPSFTTPPTKSHSLTQISSNLNRNCGQNASKRLTALTTPSPTSTTTTSQTLNLQIRPQTPPKSRQISHTLSLMPTTSATTDRTTADDKENVSSQSHLSIESFAKENIERHRKRGIFIGKKVSLKSMLEWSKKSIKKPMISSISDHKLRHECKRMFKFVQKFMRDITGVETTQERHPTAASSPSLATSDDIDIALHLLTTATQQPILRDELLVQIARQTTSNPSPDSEVRGLRLMCVCFWYFPPSHKLAPHMAAFLAAHPNQFARDVVRRKFEQQLRRSQQSHVVYVRKPHDRDEMSRVLRCVHNGFVGVFGETLDDALVDRRLVPWPIVCLTEALLRCRSDDSDDGCEREGVFRCVGDLDDVMRLKTKIDTVITSDDIHDSVLSLDASQSDIHVIASALKLYFRELKTPLIPFAAYWEALDAAHSPQRAQQLVERLPTTHRFALSYLVRFLQVFSAPEHVTHTKMDDANLSMVWAPNVLRADASQATDASLSSVFERTRAEMSFVRTLIQTLDTSFMAGVQ